MKAESYAKNAIRKLVGTWSCVIEPGRGAHAGVPDLLLLVDGVLLPVEVKIGWIEDGRLQCLRVRPAQIAWHHALSVAGGRSMLLVAMGRGKNLNVWATPAVDRGTLSQWRKGWQLNRCRRIIQGGLMTADLSL